MGTKNNGDAVLSGPEKENKIFYVLAALSDLHDLMIKAKKELSQKSKPNNNEFQSKFHQSYIDLEKMEVSKKNLSLFLKKTEFFIAWLKSQSHTFEFVEVDDKM